MDPAQGMRLNKPSSRVVDDEYHDDNDDGGGDDNDVDDGVVVKEGITFPLDSSICPAFTSRSIVSSWRLSFASKI